MPAAPLVSFVVLSYNHSRFIGECLQSILDQKGSVPFEVIVVDDASTDDSAQRIRSFRDARIHFIPHEKNQGHGPTVRDGMAQAQGSLIARIDGDDRYRPEFLEKSVHVFEQHPNVGLFYADAAIINDAGQMTDPHGDSHRVHAGQDFMGNEFCALLERNFICAPTIIARAEAWRAALPVPEGLAFHDWYFTLSIGRQYDFYYCHEVLADYRVHSGNLHAAIARNKTEERSIFWLLDRLYSEKETNATLEKSKRAVRSRVYSAHYRLLATKYFGYEMNADARRCYLRAVRYKPSHLLDISFSRQLAATCFGRTFYERAKALLKPSALRKTAA
jgi:glycosyltransferase involved in cell wall biosynthesis